jgi:putative ABC transport system substrate-binding protein
VRRRDFIAFLASGTACATTARAQTPHRLIGDRPIVGVLNAISQEANSPFVESLRHGLRDLGYIEGKNIDMALRYADGDYTRLPALAEELVRLAPRVIVTDVRLSTLEAKKASSTIPIVSPFLTDPTGLGLAASDARPGGQVTGILFTLDSLPGKQLEIVPGAKKIGVLSNATNPAQAIPRRNTEAGAAALAIKLVSAEVHGPGDLDAAFRTLAGERVDFVSVFPDALLLIERRRIASLAIGAKLPTLFAFREHVEVGGLLSYGVMRERAIDGQRPMWTGY